MTYFDRACRFCYLARVIRVRLFCGSVIERCHSNRVVFLERNSRLKELSNDEEKLFRRIGPICGISERRTGRCDAQGQRLRGAGIVRRPRNHRAGPGLIAGIFNVDKSGTLNGYALLNLPSEDGKSRRLVRLAVTGTVTVNADGTGQAKYGGPLPDGTTPPPYTEDFVITKARKSGHGKLALKIVDQRQEASILLGMGNAVTVTWSRLPDDTPEN